ncbi:MAG: cyclopropane fatty acyl phospholipid synthase [Phycisphaerales bacterium JB039]
MPTRARIEAALADADIRPGGDRAWDPAIHDDRIWRRVALGGASGLLDAWVDGWWTCPRPDELFSRAMRDGASDRLRWSWPNLWAFARDSLINAQTVARARRHIRHHYDLGQPLFEAMLDARMNYSCAFWEGARDLDQAQEAKCELICRKLGLQPHMRLLDIGCGWGGLIGYAAERFGCECVGITLSADQARYARTRYADLPVEVRLQDYRHVPDTFDRVASVGMFEHVGARNGAAFMRAVQRALKPDGLALLHFFATQRGWPTIHRPEAVWVERNIFPGMAVPSLAQVGRAVEGRFVVEDLHNFGVDYDPTLMAWHARFQLAWPRLRETYGERFGRMWTIYLLICAGAFRSRRYQLWQLILSARGVPGGYRRPRAAASAIESRPTSAHRAGAPAHT